MSGGYSIKNYTEQGGEVTHIGGKLIFDEGATVEGFPGGHGGDGESSYVLPVATDTRLGGVKVGDGLTVEADGTLSADPYTLPDATTTTKGAVRVAEAQDALTTTDFAVVVQAFNSLLDKLKNAGLMASA